ncbi:MAG: hypothetical protein JXB88_17110 [Spirochaetales bacterium]|nr:hypothetical protein [Spirochaetales bacterium]
MSFFAHGVQKNFYTVIINDHHTTTTTTGTFVEFTVQINLPMETITDIVWDFVGNGKHFYTTGSAYARYIYSEPGTYFPIVTGWQSLFSYKK